MHPTIITRVTERRWHAVENDQVIGCGDSSRRPDGRVFVSIDSWQDAVFDRLADAMLADLPRPLYTVVAEADHDMASRWRHAGFAPRRREWEYVVPTDPRVTGLGSARSPEGVTILPVGAAREAPLREVYEAIRAEVDAAVGWDSMPAEVLVRPDGTPLWDPAKYAVAVRADRYAGLARVTGRVTRQPRIGLLAVRSGERRRGIARALLAHVLGTAHRSGVETAAAEVDASNRAALALFEGAGARRAGGYLELVLR